MWLVRRVAVTLAIIGLAFLLALVSEWIWPAS